LNCRIDDGGGGAEPDRLGFTSTEPFDKLRAALSAGDTACGLAFTSTQLSASGRLRAAGKLDFDTACSHSISVFPQGGAQGGGKT
jgi:hypothetical protein